MSDFIFVCEFNTGFVNQTSNKLAIKKSGFNKEAV